MSKFLKACNSATFSGTQASFAMRTFEGAILARKVLLDNSVRFKATGRSVHLDAVEPGLTILETAFTIT